MIKQIQKLQSKVNAIKINNRNISRLLCSNVTDNIKETQKKDVELPEEPTNCCQSGCANCVYIEYATKLMETFSEGQEVQKIILDKIKDPSMKAFLEMELRMKLKTPK